MSVEQWYFPSQSKWVFFGRVVVGDTWDSQVRIPYPRHTWPFTSVKKFLASFFFIFVFSIQLTENSVLCKFYCWWLDSNCRPLALEAIALPTGPPQPPPNLSHFLFKWKTIHIFANINFTVLYLFSLFALPSLNHKIKTQDWPRTSWLQS